MQHFLVRQQQKSDYAIDMQLTVASVFRNTFCLTTSGHKELSPITQIFYLGVGNKFISKTNLFFSRNLKIIFVVRGGRFADLIFVVKDGRGDLFWRVRAVSVS